jgi:hypothetical protein
MSKKNSIGQGPGAVSLANEEGVKQILGEAVLGLWDVANNLTRLQPSRRKRYSLWEKNQNHTDGISQRGRDEQK